MRDSRSGPMNDQDHSLSLSDANRSLVLSHFLTNFIQNLASCQTSFINHFVGPSSFQINSCQELFDKKFGFFFVLIQYNIVNKNFNFHCHYLWSIINNFRNA
jgi:hypothetical protein